MAINVAITQGGLTRGARADHLPEVRLTPPSALSLACICLPNNAVQVVVFVGGCCTGYCTLHNVSFYFTNFSQHFCTEPSPFSLCAVDCCITIYSSSCHTSTTLGVHMVSLLCTMSPPFPIHVSLLSLLLSGFAHLSRWIA